MTWELDRRSLIRVTRDFKRTTYSTTTSPVTCLRIDDEGDVQTHQQQQRQLWTQIGAFLERADQSIDELDQRESEEGLLSSAIVRGCHDLAAIVGELASQLEEQEQNNADERRAVAHACIAEVRQLQHEQQHHECHVDGEFRRRDGESLISSSPSQMMMMPFKEEGEEEETEMLRIIAAATNFLRDVESSLRMIDQRSAEELAEASLTVARLFVSSLQSACAQMTVEPNPGRQDRRQTSQQQRPTMDIEILEDDCQESKSPSRSSSSSFSSKKRVRVLWPPIGPGVAHCLQWTQEEALKRPILSVALGMMLWPAAILPVVIGAPLVLLDEFVQDLYNHFDEAPLVVGLERGAAHVYHTGRLAVLGIRLAGRQTLYIVQKQLDRQGGVGPMARHCLDWVVDRITHPISTVQGAWSGIFWTADRIRSLVDEVRRQQPEHWQAAVLQELQV